MCSIFLCLEVTLFFIPRDLCQGRKVCVCLIICQKEKSHMAATKNEGERQRIQFTLLSAFLSLKKKKWHNILSLEQFTEFARECYSRTSRFILTHLISTQSVYMLLRLSILDCDFFFLEHIWYLCGFRKWS